MNPVTSKLTGIELEIVPVIPVPVAVTVTVYAPGETDVCVKTVSVAMAELPTVSFTIVGFTVAPGPPETPRVRVTFPLKPFRLVMVTREVADEPDGKLNVDGLAERRTSGGATTVTVMLTE